MAVLHDDTPPAVRQMLIDRYRRMSPRQKLEQVRGLTQAVQRLALARIRRQYGTVPQREEQLRSASLWLERETMVRVFNWDPRVKGY